MTNPTNNNKKANDSFKAKAPKTGSSNSRIDFLKEGTDFLTDLDTEEDDNEDISPEDIATTDLSDFDDEMDEVFTTETEEEEITEEVKEVKTGKVTVISRKVAVKKPEEAPEVEKEVSKLVNELVPDISQAEIKNFLDMSSGTREQLLSGEMQILGRNDVSFAEKKEFLSKLDEITSTEDVSKANSAFVLKWLKNRS